MAEFRSVGPEAKIIIVASKDTLSIKPYFLCGVPIPICLEPVVELNDGFRQPSLLWFDLQSFLESPAVFAPVESKVQEVKNLSPFRGEVDRSALFFVDTEVIGCKSFLNFGQEGFGLVLSHFPYPHPAIALTLEFEFFHGRWVPRRHGAESSTKLSLCGSTFVPPFAPRELPRFFTTMRASDFQKKNEPSLISRFDFGLNIPLTSPGSPKFLTRLSIYMPRSRTPVGRYPLFQGHAC